MSDHFSKDKDFQNDIPAFHTRLSNYFRKSFTKIHDDLMRMNFDCHLSGSTAAALLFDSKKIFCANVGDSRAVLYSIVKKS